MKMDYTEVSPSCHTERVNHRVRFARKRFGTFEVIDFVVVLMGYAISGESTRASYYERLQPFATPFMALFGRKQLPHRSTERPLACCAGSSECGSATERVLAGRAGPS